MNQAAATTKLKIDLGVFAYNKADVIEHTLKDLLDQECLRTHDLRILVLLNGCTDSTPEVVEKIAKQHLEIFPVHLAQGGKSRTWNFFVHEESRTDCDYLMFCDADIRLTSQHMLTKLLSAIEADPNLHAANSRPRKDLAFTDRRLTLVERLINSAAESANDWRDAICGSLYVMPAKKARRYRLPIGLPVEDGFLHACILTDNFAQSPDKMLVVGSEAFHIYESERTIRALIRHQTRIVIGSAINDALFRTLHESAPSRREAIFREASEDTAWLGNFLKNSLPRWPYGYISPHFLTKRSKRALKRPSELLKPRRLIVFLAGAGFDAIVYILSQLRMARGVGAGFW